MVNTMETIDIKLNESETQMFGQLFTYYDSANEGIVPQSAAKQVLNASNLDQNVLDQVLTTRLLTNVAIVSLLIQCILCFVLSDN